MSPQTKHQLKDSLGYRVTQLAADMKADVHRQVTQYGITTKQGAVLVALSLEQDLNVTQIADRIGVDFGGTSRLVDRLDTKGFVCAHTDGADRRARRVALTTKGSATAEKVMAASKATNELFLKRVTQQEAKQFREILERLLGASG